MVTRKYAAPLLRKLRGVETMAFRYLPDHPRINRVLSQYAHFLENGRFADTVVPRTFNDHLMRIKLARPLHPLVATITDKWLLKTHVEALLGPGYTPDTLALLETPVAVDMLDVHGRCIIKPTHLSGEVIVKDAGPLTIAERRRMKRWFDLNHFHRTREAGYKNLTPRIIVEAYLGDASAPPPDIKFLCFQGRPKLIQVDWQRFAQHRRDFYDSAGQHLPMSYDKPRHNAPFPAPALLPAMLDVARRLAAGFPFIRVDCYAVADRVYVGEMTSTPQSANMPIRPYAADLLVGSLFTDPERVLAAADFNTIARTRRLQPRVSGRPSPVGPPRL